MNNSSEEADAWMQAARYVQRSNFSSTHYLGGPTQHTGSDCPECGRQVTLIWDLDLTAHDIPPVLKRAFSSLQRLPLYVCSLCNVLSYRVSTDAKIACYPHGQELDWCDSYESPHCEARAEIERQPIRLYPLPSDIDAIWAKHHYQRYGLLHPASLNPDESAKLQRYLKSVEFPPEGRSRYYSQLCGNPYRRQGLEFIGCPNPSCEGDIEMKSLAHICPTDSPGLGDSIGFFDFQYFACPACFSISVQYECT